MAVLTGLGMPELMMIVVGLLLIGLIIGVPVYIAMRLALRKQNKD